MRMVSGNEDIHDSLTSRLCQLNADEESDDAPEVTWG